MEPKRECDADQLNDENRWGALCRLIPGRPSDFQGFSDRRGRQSERLPPAGFRQHAVTSWLATAKSKIHFKKDKSLACTGFSVISA